MIYFAAFILAVVAFAVFVLAAFLTVEIIMSFAARSDQKDAAEPAGRLAVIIPAHDEAGGIAATIKSVRADLGANDQLIVVADNCRDETASLARSNGATAIERNDPVRRGKGYAMQFGIDHLRADPPDVVVFVDADCTIEPGALKRIGARALRLRKPVQALYLMRTPKDARPKQAVSAFAWLLMNRVRMAGLQELAGVTRLTGAGMAFPWAIISSMNLASGEIVEDLAMTIRLIERKQAPVLDLGAVVVSELAASEAGATRQRARWEHGSIRLALRYAPRLFLRGVSGDLAALALAFDIAIPPLVMFAAMILIAMATSLPFALIGHDEPLKLAMAAAFVAGCAILGAWAAYGRTVLPPQAIGGLFGYLGSKLRVYGREGRKSTKAWTRTDRGGGGAQ